MLFYDLIVTAAKGKSGQLMFKNRNGADVECGHPGKVITRSWYEKNKHIFPASRFEIYDTSMIEAAKDTNKSNKKSNEKIQAYADLTPMKVGKTEVGGDYKYKILDSINFE